MFHLSVCADTVFLELPFEQRVKEINRAGFLAEFWGWQGRDIDALAADNDTRIGIINGVGKGSMMHPEYADEFLDDARSILAVARKLGLKTLNLLAGQIDVRGNLMPAKYPITHHPATTWATAYKVLSQIAELAEQHDVTYNLENLNTKVDHAGYPLPRIEDTVRLVEAVGSPRIKILFDIYHAQIEEGNVIELLRNYADFLGYIHVADVPGRHEPGTGEINYRNVAQTLRDLKYEGTVGLEAFPLNNSREAMARFREVFSE
jgi:hydroxypyruvate isomerase